MAKQSVTICADSITDHAEPARITTYMLRYWRAFHGEMMTHREFSRCASSSRAIPVKKVLKQVWSDAAGPTVWGSNKPGMQAGEELQGVKLWMAKRIWTAGAKAACIVAWGLNKCGLHKQHANRGLEPYQYISVMVTATNYDNFFNLRCHEAAMPEFKALAEEMRSARLGSTPMLLKDGQWHIPLMKPEERENMRVTRQLEISTARHARTSYERHDGKPSQPQEDCDLHRLLVGADPIHASPTEHQVLFTSKVLPKRRRTDVGIELKGNLRGEGLVQYRKMIEHKDAYRFYLGSEDEKKKFLREIE